MLAQIPEIDSSTQVRPINLPGGFLWAVNFKLPVPAAEDGYIVQKIIQSDTGQASDGGNVTYYEAWQVKKGETKPRQSQSVAEFTAQRGKPAPNKPEFQVPVNDIFYKGYSFGSAGYYTIHGYASFYHLAALPPEDKFTVGTKFAGQLMATLHKPSFWTGKAYLYRKLTYNYLFTESKNDLLDDSKGQLNNEPPQKIDYRILEDWLGW